MPSVMAIVSKSIFEKEARAGGRVLDVGEIWSTSEYVSLNKLLDRMTEDGDLFLVSVRPGEELHLVARLERPSRTKTGWRGKANRTPITDIGSLRSSLVFASGTPLPTKSGALAMSLQTPRVLADADVKLLERALGHKPPLAAKPPTIKATGSARPITKSPAKARAAKSTPNKSPPDAAVLEAAEAVAHHAPEAALTKLLELWREAPSAPLADIIDEVSSRVTFDGPTIRGKGASPRAEWAKLAKNARLVDRPALLDALADTISTDAEARLRVIERWMPDPRVDAALAKMIEEPPFHAIMTQPFYERVFKLATKIQDPRQLTRIDNAEAAITATVAKTMAEWLRRRLATLRPTLEHLRANAPAPSARRAAVSSKSRELDDLLSAVYADPTDNAARLVYADALLERGDPRGELISVQMRLAEHPNDREAKQREKALLERHAKSWLGTAGRYIAADFVFERGFLASCRIKGDPKDLGALAADPIWSTVHTFAGSWTIARSPHMKSLRALTFVAEYWDPEEDEGVPNWKELLEGPERPLETLDYESDLDTDDEVRALHAAKALPHLRSLTLGEAAFVREDLFKRAKPSVFSRLEHFKTSVHRYYETLLPPIRRLLALEVPRVEIGVHQNWQNGCTLLLEHIDDKRRRCTVHLSAQYQATSNFPFIKELPKNVTELRVKTAKGFKKAAHRALGAELAKLRLAVVTLDGAPPKSARK